MLPVAYMKISATAACDKWYLSHVVKSMKIKYDVMNQQIQMLDSNYILDQSNGHVVCFFRSPL